MKIVIESPFAGDVATNARFATWCMRAAFAVDRVHGFATHLVCPLILDDNLPDERQAGIEWAWAWAPGVPHWFFVDLGCSRGMSAARKRCETLGIPTRDLHLETYSHDDYHRFQLGYWPPGTAGACFGEIS